MNGKIRNPGVLASRIWTRVTEFISYDVNHYPTRASFWTMLCIISWLSLPVSLPACISLSLYTYSYQMAQFIPEILITYVEEFNQKIIHTIYVYRSYNTHTYTRWHKNAHAHAQICLFYNRNKEAIKLVYKNINLLLYLRKGQNGFEREWKRVSPSETIIDLKLRYISREPCFFFFFCASFTDWVIQCRLSTWSPPFQPEPKTAYSADCSSPTDTCGRKLPSLYIFWRLNIFRCVSAVLCFA